MATIRVHTLSDSALDEIKESARQEGREEMRRECLMVLTAWNLPVNSRHNETLNIVEERIRALQPAPAAEPTGPPVPSERR